MPKLTSLKQKQISVANYRRNIRNYLKSKGLVAWGYLDAHISLPNEYLMCALGVTGVTFFRWKNQKDMYTIELPFEDITEEILDCYIKRYEMELKLHKMRKNLTNLNEDFND